MASIFESIIIGAIVALFRAIISYIKKYLEYKEEFKVKEAVKSAVKGAVVGGITGIATTNPAVVVATSAVSHEISKIGKETVERIADRKKRKFRFNEMFSALFREWIYTDHAKTAQTLKLVKNGKLKGVRYLFETVCPIHPDYAKYLPDSTTAIIETWKTGRKILKTKGLNEARKYFYEALSYQVNKDAKRLINEYYKQGIIREFMRQILWTDIKTVNRVLRNYSDEEIKEFLIKIADDELEYEEEGE